MNCQHQFHEREASVATEGLCPICLLAEIERMRADKQALMQAIAWLEAENATLREALNDARMSPTMRILKIGERELQLRRQRERKK